MYFKMILILAAFCFMGCSKDIVREGEVKKSPAQLLTQQPWTLTSYGTDYNSNGTIDESEESIQECQKDNLYTFNIDGSGFFSDNLLICANGIPELPFDWSLSGAGTILRIGAAEVKIIRLNENELVFFHELGTPMQSLKFISSYRH